MNFHVYHHESERATRLLEVIHAQLEKIMEDLATLKAQVKTNTDVAASALILINGIAARITAAGTDPAALQELTASLKKSDDELAAAVAANTPAAPAV